MNDWQYAIVLAVGGTASTVGVGVVSNALWEWLRDSISIRSSEYIDIRGTWKVTCSYEHVDGRVQEYEEKFILKQQFGQRFRGTLFSPHPSNPAEIIELHLRGQFKDKFHAVFWYEHRSSKLTDVGAGTLQINADHMSAEGASANFGVSSPTKPAIVKFHMSKSL